ncbi:UDP-N-acetylglucosamine--undecaprenyl-phosphate N-acetylglucosaminephosphotransferase [Photobacterium sp. MCCC 1A19761]|uniref:UDP-N-acetylglucosamine--undecaprenyl-phosphate N-acetylglucosaminephosphotransferase n=1 Tax=Photobacterium sp. MCCC 1A19761 TaxID=3115000 RepID=UPI00307F1EA0
MTATAFVFVFVFSFCSLFVFRKLAKRVGLVDKPNARKLHQGVIPLVGGVSIFTTLTIAFLLFTPIAQDTILYLGSAAVLVMMGVIDDRLDISFKIRLVIQAAVSLAMIQIAGKSLHNLGFLMGSEAIELPLAMSYLVTIFGVIGAINAFNMVDGIDGLLGGLASVTFAALGYMFWVDGNAELAAVCGLIVTAMVPYIMLNLGFPLGRRFKVFMGDAGSIFIGFTVIWLLIEATQGERVTHIRPVTALWVIAVPLMDMATIMIRRIRKGQSPFKPDREHLHHICQRIGLSSGMSLVVICSLASVLAGIGIWSDVNKISESVMFFSFLAVFVGYFLSISYIWRITTFIHKLMGRQKVSELELEMSQSHVEK